MSSNPPSHRSPLTLLSKLKRQLSKSPVTQHRKQPIEHQYLPIPTVSFSESLHSNRSTYSCSNNSSASSFVFIDHNEEPASDEYRPFLPLIIQHELQQRLAAVSAPPRVAPTRAQRARFIPPPPNEPPSPTSTASSKSPVTPIFSSSFLDWDEDGIMTLSSSEVGSISEYSLPTSLSAYIEEAKSIRSRRSRKSRSQTSSDTNAGAHGMPLQVSLSTSYNPTTKHFFSRRPRNAQEDHSLRFLHLLHVLYLNPLCTSNRGRMHLLCSCPMASRHLPIWVLCERGVLVLVWV